MSGAPGCIYAAQTRAENLEKQCRTSIEELVETLVRIKNLQSDLRDCEDFEEGPDEQLKNCCEDLLRSLAIVKEDAGVLENISAELFTLLGFHVEWDDEREEWLLIGKYHER
jgi:hypothetical protein